MTFKLKAKELKKGYDDLEKTIKEEQNRERQFNQLSKEITKLNNGISKNNTQISGFQRQIRDLESEVQRFTEQLANRSTENEKLTEFNSESPKNIRRIIREKRRSCVS